MDELEFLLEVAIQNPHYRPMFYEKISGFEVFVITDYGSYVDENNQSHSIKRLRKTDGSEIIPFFSTIEKLHEFEGKNALYSSMRIHELFDNIRGYEAVLNPGMEISKEFSMKEVEFIADDKIFKPSREAGIGEGSEIIISTPDDYPQEMIERLKKLFEIEHEIEFAYLFQYSMENEENESPKYMVIIKTNGDFEKEAGKAIIAIEGSLEKNARVDFIEYDTSTGIEEIVEQYFIPFYVKENK